MSFYFAFDASSSFFPLCTALRATFSYNRCCAFFPLLLSVDENRFFCSLLVLQLLLFLCFMIIAIDIHFL